MTETIHYATATAWLFRPLVDVLRRAAPHLHRCAHGKRLQWVTAIQYNRYGEGDHFEQLHLDELPGATAYKELSVVVFLSERTASCANSSRFSYRDDRRRPSLDLMYVFNRHRGL